jgi:hypothetical protein
VGVEEAGAVVARRVLPGDVRDHGAPPGRQVLALHQLGEQDGLDVDLDQPATAWRTRGGLSRAAGEAAVDEVTGVVGDGDPPLRAVLPGDQEAGVLGEDRPPARQLGGVVVEAEEGGRADPDLDPVPPPGLGRRGPCIPLLRRALLRRALVASRPGRLVRRSAAGLASLGEHRGGDLRPAEVVEAAVEQADEQVGPQLVDRGGVPGAADGVGELLQPFGRGRGLGRGEPVRGDRGAPVRCEVAADAAFLDRALSQPIMNPNPASCSTHDKPLVTTNA